MIQVFPSIDLDFSDVLIVFSSVTYLGKEAFEASSSYSKFFITIHFITIHNDVFLRLDYYYISSLILPTSLATISYGAFYYAALTSLSIPTYEKI